MDGMDPTVAKSEKHCGTRNQCQNCSPNQGALSRLETLQRIEGGKTAYTGWYARTLFFFPVFRAHRPLSHEREELVADAFISLVRQYSERIVHCRTSEMNASATRSALAAVPSTWSKIAK